MRQFTDEVAAVGKLPLMIGVTGYAGSGKTLSALRIAAGVQRVHGGDVWCIDTENKAQEYADAVKFRRVAMSAPFSPSDFLEAVQYIRGKGGKNIVIDSMSDEHDGPGGVLDMHFQYMQGKQQSMNQPGWAMVKGARKRWEGYVRTLRDHEDVVFTPCWRAKLAYKPKTKDEKVRQQTEGTRDEPTDHQWDVATTSDLPYLCSVRFLLYPGTDGRPLLKPTTMDEKILVKTSLAYAAYMQTIEQLDESVGQRLAEIAQGKSARASSPTMGSPLNFHPEYDRAKGLIDQSDLPTVDDYIKWCVERTKGLSEANAAKIHNHIVRVSAIYKTMLEHEAAE